MNFSTTFIIGWRARVRESDGVIVRWRIVPINKVNFLRYRDESKKNSHHFMSNSLSFTLWYDIIPPLFSAHLLYHFPFFVPHPHHEHISLSLSVKRWKYKRKHTKGWGEPSENKWQALYTDRDIKWVFRKFFIFTVIKTTLCFKLISFSSCFLYGWIYTIVKDIIILRVYCIQLNWWCLKHLRYSHLMQKQLIPGSSQHSRRR